MESIFQIMGMAIITAIACCATRKETGALSVVLSMAACVLILLITFRFMQPVLEIVERLQVLTGLSSAVIAPVLKVTGIGFLVQIAGTVCQDAGEHALHKTVEIAGGILSIYVALPLMSSVLDLLEEILKK